jgi:uncharacterized protein involved in outer membrane biogenesis
MKKWLLLSIAGLLVIIVVVLLALPYITNLETVRNQAATAASSALQRRVTLTRLSLRAIPSPGLQIGGLRIAERDGSPIGVVDRIIVEVKLAPLLKRELVVDRVIVKQPKITLSRKADGSLNLPLPPAAPAAPTAPGAPATRSLPATTVALEEARIEDGDVTIREQQEQGTSLLLRLQGLNMLVKDLSLRGRTPDDFTRSLTGTVRLEVKEGSIGKMETVGRILSVLNVKRLLSGKAQDVTREGVPFDSITGTLRFNNGLMTTDDLKLQSAVLDADVKGTFNLPDKQMNLVVSALGTDFDVQGPADNPAVSSRAVTKIKEGIGDLLKKGLGLFR